MRKNPRRLCIAPGCRSRFRGWSCCSLGCHSTCSRIGSPRKDTSGHPHRLRRSSDSFDLCLNLFLHKNSPLTMISFRKQKKLTCRVKYTPASLFRIKLFHISFLAKPQRSLSLRTIFVKQSDLSQSRKAFYPRRNTKIHEGFFSHEFLMNWVTLRCRSSHRPSAERI